MLTGLAHVVSFNENVYSFKGEVVWGGGGGQFLQTWFGSLLKKRGLSKRKG